MGGVFLLSSTGKNSKTSGKWQTFLHFTGLGINCSFPFDVTALIEAIYDMVDQNQEACRVLILGNTSSTVLMRMIALAKEDSIAYWRKELPNASETELEMMYTHLSNGLMHVVVEGYDKYSKEEMIHFVSRVVKASLSVFQSSPKPLA